MWEVLQATATVLAFIGFVIGSYAFGKVCLLRPLDRFFLWLFLMPKREYCPWWEFGKYKVAYRPCPPDADSHWWRVGV